MSSKLFWFVQWHATGGPEYVDLSWNVWDFDGIWQVPPSPGFGTPRVDVAGVMHVSGDIGLRLGIPKNIVQVGAIGVTGAVERILPDGGPDPEMVAAVKEAARGLSRELGAGRLGSGIRS